MKKVKLGEVGCIVTGNTPSTKDVKNYTSEDICFIKPSDIFDNTITKITNSEFYISEHARSKARILPPKSVLVTCIGIIGKVGVNVAEVAFNQQINAIIPNKEICNYKYLAYSILSAKEKLNCVANAPVVPIINKTQFSELEIPLPSLEEQKEIADRLDKVSSLIEKRKTQLSKLDQLIKSRFIEMFGLFDKVELYTVADIIMGQSPESSSYNDNGKGTPFFQGKADYGDKYTVVRHWTDKPTKRAKQGDVLMSVRAPVGPVNISSVDCCIGRGLCSINAHKSKTNNEFLYNALKTIENEIASMGTGSTFKAITKNDVYSLLIPNAPFDLQEAFSHFVEQTDKSKLAIQKSIDKLETLKKSLMQQYFG
ncbi:MAG: restriction endonuclease subunit S [Clostridia bacterium]|nr:restriction endonuclease subunit S [Clostridia bacterium]